MLVATRALRGARAAAARTEALRVLRSNLLVAVADADHPVVIVTSANPGEGRTTTCAGLAGSLAAAGSRTVLVDLDLRHPELHLRLGGADRVGVFDVLAGRASLPEALHLVEPTADDAGGGHGFHLLAAGASVRNTTELLGSPRMGELLASIAASTDIVVVDTAPVLPVADTLVLARRATGALLVVEAGRTPATDVRAASDALERHDVRVLGVALNKLDAREVPRAYGREGGSLVDVGGGGGGGDAHAEDGGASTGGTAGAPGPGPAPGRARQLG